MILNTINPHSSSKLDQIMSRYRPIAPKPQMPLNPELADPHTPPPPTHQITTTTNLLQSKRGRKRGRYGISSYSTRKRGKTTLPHVGSSSSYGFDSLATTTNTHLGLSLQNFNHAYTHHFPLLNPSSSVSDSNSEKHPLNFLSLPPLVPYTSSPLPSPQGIHGNQFMDLNLSTSETTPKEMDLLQNLHASSVSGPPPSNIIAPQPVRPIGSSISVGCISEDPSSNSNACLSKKKPEEVEAEAESDALPVVVSDSNNKVRLANSAFKEMVGQPECLWLDSMETCKEQTRRGSACKRISGEVMLDLSNNRVPVSSNGFSCRVRIEWGNNGQKSSISAPCNVMKLLCESKDYLFTWRIHTREASETNARA